MLVGAHVPTMGDYRKMAAYARGVGCECVQVFSCSPRSYAVPPVSDATAAQLAALRAPGAGPTCPPMLVHVGYLVNLAADDPERRERSCASFAGELVRAAALGAEALNVHAGSSKELARADVPRRIAQVVARARRMALEQAGERAASLPVMFEDTAGAGDTYGTTVAELAAILRELETLGRPAAEAGVCIDTCHAWAAGYDLSGRAGWDELLGQVDELCAPAGARTGGLSRLRWIHANDCKHERGSRKDRHEWIGRGRIGLEGFAEMARRPELARAGVVVEMPGEAPEKDAVNVGLLKRLRDEGRAGAAQA